MNHKKPWGGRFAAATDSLVEQFTASVGFDRRLYHHDIAGSIAHARMLARVGVLSGAECEQIVGGLERIEQEIADGRFQWRTELEDVHMNIESRLTELIGEVGKKLHTGRSRNDQVATDLRLFLRDAVDAVCAEIDRLQRTLLDLAEREAGTVMPGFTHLQHAQPVVFGHHVLAWFQMLERDYERLQDARRRINVLPLGAAALAGTTYPVDRAYTAELLGFDAVAENSLDAVSDRDFAIEFLACAALIMTHLSRMAEELILWSSSEFGYIELSDAYCTGSSIMPQKKNPDVPELVRGKTGRVNGHLLALLTLMKAQPLAYNKDNQEDKEPVFDGFDTVLASLRVYDGMFGALQVNRERLREAAGRGFTTATDLADYLVDKGVPFRDAHEIVGRLVRLALEQGKDLAELPLAVLQQHHAGIGEDVFDVLTLEGSVDARDHVGGTAVRQVKEAIGRARARLDGRA